MENHFKLLKVLIGIVLIAGMYACNTNSSEERPNKVVVKTTGVTKHSSLLSKSYPAVIQASSDVKLAFRVAGPIINIFVDEGDHVKENQILAQIDPRDYKLQLQATEARYEEVKAEVGRITSLYKKGKVSENDYDKAVSGLKQITAKYNAHKNALSDTKLRAPFSGNINQIFFEADETVDAGMPIVSMIDTQNHEIVTHLPASDYLNKDRFSEFTCRTVDEPDTPLQLKLRNIVSKANLNGLYPAYFNVSNPPKGKILPGMSAEVIIKYKSTGNQLFEIPATSVFKNGDKSTVWVFNEIDKTIHSKQVEIVKIKPSGSAIVKGEITEADTIISAGVHRLKEGQKVEVLKEPSESNVGGLL
ncbi:efflux RND transporter periplasmic adaptor subunit [Marinilabilia rubra]|uniref:Efflux RND transporter periplasmic adaptor subunit n=1 Tax=Marinilabilia rubra TaxID=2162893 RepID=A0A2U2B4V3_9BACT|nr:efflux RND transporter periplasmic adaptor subunit [Marinilabilia rubra]PWD98086.1 efflux RND transporter periplasmic adaptor subunit [Marinilabilia rubra]